MYAKNLRSAFHLLCVVVLGMSLVGAAPLWGQDRTGDEIDVVREEKPSGSTPEDFALRVRVTEITPSEPTDITWRHGGEGTGGSVTRGKLVEKLEVGQWSPSVSVGSFQKGRPRGRLYLTFEVGSPGTPDPKERSTGDQRIARLGYSKNVQLEIEFRYKGKVVKTLKELGPEGGSITIQIPWYQLTGAKTPADPDFLNDLVGIHELALRRAQWMETLPWANWPTPKKYAIVTQVGGYGHGIGRGIRTTNLDTMAAECRSLRQLGVNSLRNPNSVLLAMIAGKKGFASHFGRALMGSASGYPVPQYRKGRDIPHAGCPYGPTVPELTAQNIEKSLQILKTPVPEIWALTVDEIGSVVNRSPEGTGHVAVCPNCAKAFREFLKGESLSPADFGKTNWDEITPIDVYEPRRQSRGAPSAPEEPAEKPWTPPDLTDKYTALTAYHTVRFISRSSAKLFTPLRDAFDRANEAKRQAISRGETDTPVAKQPWVYTYALRGQGFIMRGTGNLAFMDFYRQADNALVYETSSRGPRIWGWDSYVCDAGRMVASKMNKRFGVYVKPHRGAPVQRALTAVSRNATMLYWYTYGPSWAKGDDFSKNLQAMELTSKVGHLIGKTEDVLYGSSWARPAEVAVVSPWCSVIWNGITGRNDPARMAAWENAKWTYSALTHAHIPVDPLDEVMVETEDLSQYKIIYVSGPNITNAAAAALEKYVRGGGTLYTSGWGLARDEANQPLKVLAPVLGLDGRNDPEMYYKVMMYGALRIDSYTDSKRVITPVPDGAKVLGGGPFKAAFKPIIGREVLKPSGNTEVLVRFSDGSPAITRNKYGKGQAYVVGFFPALEYSAPVRTERFDMARDLEGTQRSYVTAPALALTKPAVHPAEAMVEGVLLKNDTTGKLAVTLMNWAYRVGGQTETRRGAQGIVEIVPFKNLKITIRDAGEVHKVVSAMLDKTLPMEKTDNMVTVILPELTEGDVLLLE